MPYTFNPFTGTLDYFSSGYSNLFQDGDDGLAQYNNTNAQSLKLFNTRTDASNGEWLQLDWDSNFARIFQAANGTGTIRELQIGVGTVRIGSQAPGANNTGCIVRANGILECDRGGGNITFIHARATGFGGIRLASGAANNEGSLEALSVSTVDTKLKRTAAGTWSVLDGSDDPGRLKSVLWLQEGPTARPTAEAAVRGMLWLVEGGAGVADTVEICTKDSSDAYDWRTLI